MVLHLLLKQRCVWWRRFWAVKTDTVSTDASVRVTMLASDGSESFDALLEPEALKMNALEVYQKPAPVSPPDLRWWTTNEVTVTGTGSVTPTNAFGQHAVSTEFDSTVSDIEMYRATVSVDMGSSSASRFRVSFPSGFFMSSTESAYVDVDTQGGTLVTVVRQGSADAEATAEYRASNPSVVDVT